MGAYLTLAALLGAIAALSPWKNAGMSAFGIGFTSFAVAAAYQRKGRRRTQLQVLASIALCIALGTWMSHFGEERPRLTRADVSRTAGE